jgi:hypothetical protein
VWMMSVFAGVNPADKTKKKGYHAVVARLTP